MRVWIIGSGVGMRILSRTPRGQVVRLVRWRSMHPQSIEQPVFGGSETIRSRFFLGILLIRRVKATVQFFDERIGTEEMMKMLNDKSFHRVPEMIRALVPACVSLQIPVKMGMKLVAQTAALFWSVEHVFCNFEVGISSCLSSLIVALFLSQWLRSIERDGMEGLTNQEAKIVSLLRDLLFEADPDADSRQPMSALLLTVWADQFDGVNVWGSTVPMVRC